MDDELTSNTSETPATDKQLEQHVNDTVQAPTQEIEPAKPVSVFDALDQDNAKQQTDANAATYPNYTVPEKPKDVKTNPQPVNPSPETKEALPATETSLVCSLQLSIVDYHGWPIPNLGFRILDISQKGTYDAQDSAPNQRRVKELLTGKTDAKGQAPKLEGLTLGMRLEFQIQDSQKKHYNTVAIDTVKSIEANACLASPKDKFTIRTFSHEGVSGNATQQRKQRVSQHQQTPEKTANISRQKNVKPSVQTMQRDDKGQPILAVLDGLKNMWGVNKNKTDKKLASPSAGKSDIEKVNKLIDSAMELINYEYETKNSARIIADMINGVNKPDGKKEPTKSIQRCARYVKVALWQAGYSITKDGDIDSNISVAKKLGPALLRNGFTDITDTLPDARWAAPGDVIVYDDVTNANNAGHIDIRTYDGYVSDFFTKRLPSATKRRVTGIYRKYYDPMPEKRMRAFLKVLREWECHEELVDSKRYFMLGMGLKINGERTFTDTSKHPFEDTEIQKNNPAGAYQILLSTYNAYMQPRFGIEKGFTPLIQDRITIAMLENIPGHSDVLGLIRIGKITEAVNKLGSTWTSLPSSPKINQRRHEKRASTNYVFTMEDLLSKYEIFLKELLG